MRNEAPSVASQPPLALMPTPTAPKPLSAAEAEFNKQLPPESQFARPVRPAPQNAAEELQQSLQPKPVTTGQLEPTAPVRLSEPATPQELSAQNPMRPMQDEDL